MHDKLGKHNCNDHISYPVPRSINHSKFNCWKCDELNILQISEVTYVIERPIVFENYLILLTKLLCTDGERAELFFAQIFW